MALFGDSSQINGDVEKTTSEMRTPPFNQVTVNGPSQIKVHVSERSHEVFLCCPTHVHLEKRSSEYIRCQKYRFGKKWSRSVFQIWSRDRKFSVFHFLCTSPSSFAACFTQYVPPPSPSSDLSQLSPSSTLLWRSGNLTYRVHVYIEHYNLCTITTFLSLPLSFSHHFLYTTNIKKIYHYRWLCACACSMCTCMCMCYTKCTYMCMCMDQPPHDSVRDFPLTIVDSWLLFFFIF